MFGPVSCIGVVVARAGLGRAKLGSMRIILCLLSLCLGSQNLGLSLHQLFLAAYGSDTAVHHGGAPGQIVAVVHDRGASGEDTPTTREERCDIGPTAIICGFLSSGLLYTIQCACIACLHFAF